MMTRGTARKKLHLYGGGSAPTPPEFIALGPEWLKYNPDTGAEDRAPQECDPSAVSSAEMAGAASAAPNLKSDPPDHN